ncbi:MAG: MBL fold metallo-hydrolase [Oscillospiraceae bacterium]|nr:MBL fold metallo-hydrolase [Oscillospiraceae bacterium]
MNESVTVTWLGHSCFKLSYKGFCLITDPYQDGSVPGYPPLAQSASAVYCSHGHRDHGAADKIAPDGKSAPEDFAVEEFTGPHDHHGGARRGMNTIRQFRFGARKVVHMGDVGCVPEEEILERLRGCDLLLLPVGGYYTVDAREAREIWQKIAPRAVVPMHYRSADPAFGYEVLSGVEDFLALFPDEQVLRLESDSFTLGPDEPRGVVLPRFAVS